MKTVLKIILIGAAAFVSLFILIMLIFFFSVTNESIFGAKDEIETDTPPTSLIKDWDIERQRADSLAVVKKTEDSIAFINLRNAIRDLNTYIKKVDKFENTTFYTHPNAPSYDNVNFIYPYIGSDGYSYWLRLKIQYASSDWLFINKVKVKTDEQQYDLIGSFERDHNSMIWEWRDISVDKDTKLMLEDIANSKEVWIRYVGQQYYKERQITKKEKEIILQTLNIYGQIK